LTFFDAAYAIVVGEEGGYSDDPRDPGNWTGGKVGVGELKGTLGGISAAAYPEEDIKNLTPERRKFLFKRDYWDKANLDAVSWEIALIEFDAAVNLGSGFEHTLHGTAVEIAAERAMRYAENKNLQTYGKGWFIRLFDIFKKAQTTPQ
jgi:lysozyme family protein